MKKLLSLVFILVTMLSYSQTIYELTLNENNKVSLSNITNDINTYDRYVNDSSITFSSNINYSENYFDSICNLYDYDLINYKTNKTTYNYAEKAGGQDCPDAELVCSNSTFSGNSSGYGTQELNSINEGCLNGENESSWYYVHVDGDGTLEMEINPTSPSDYDFALWGPFDVTTANDNCPPTSEPIRCSYASDNGSTGLGVCNGQQCNDTTEGFNGNGWVAPIDADSGDVYILLIDNFSTSGVDFDLTWGGSATLGCVDVTLPIELKEFYVAKEDGVNVVNWSTYSELNNDYYIVERLIEGMYWEHIYKNDGAGTTTLESTYKYYDRDFGDKINYYRLTQVDFDGKQETFNVVAVDNRSRKKHILKTINMLGQEVDENYEGIVIDIYNNGDSIKRYN